MDTPDSRKEAKRALSGTFKERFIAPGPVLMVMTGVTNVALAVTVDDYPQQPPCCKGTTVTPLTTFESISTLT